jgi:hypothetical protein
MWFLLAPNAVANRAKPLVPSGDVNSASNRLWFSHGLQYADHFRCRYTSGHGVHGTVPHRALRIHEKDRRLGDAALLPWVVEIPGFDDAPLRIAQNRERQGQLEPQCLRLFRCIHRDRDEARPRRTDFLVVLAVVHQLAEAEGSPMAAIEE